MLEDDNSICGVADQSGGPHFQKRGSKDMLYLLGYHTAKSPRGKVILGFWKGGSGDRRIPDSGGAVQIPSWPWNNEPALHPCGGAEGGI